MVVIGNFQHAGSIIATNPPITTYKGGTDTYDITDGKYNATNHHNSTARPVPWTKLEGGQQQHHEKWTKVAWQVNHPKKRQT